MDSLVSRLKKYVNQPKINIEDVYPNDLIDKPAVAKYKAQNGMHSSTFSEDPQVIRTLINSIPDRFYNSNSDKVVEEEIIDFCGDREIIRTQTRISKLASHNKAVCRRIYQLVLEKQPQYQTELNNVLILQKHNLEALNHCQTARHNMELAMEGLVVNRLIVLVNYRRKCRLERVQLSLKRIKTLQLSVVKLMELLEVENFSKAIELYTECQAVVDDFVSYVCIDKMRNKLKTIRMNIEESLDSALMRMCEHFDPDRYTMLQTSFQLLGSGPSSIDQLQMHFTSVIQSRSMQILMSCLDNVTISSVIDNSSYPNYCELLSQSRFIECVLKLCYTLFEIVRCYQATINWHKHSLKSNDDSSKSLSNNSPKSTSQNEQNSGLNPNWSENYQLDRLLDNKSRLWCEVSGKVKILIEKSQINCSGLDLNDVMKLLAIINKFTTIGTHFCENQSLDLQDALRIKFQDFFRSYHIKHLERLKMFLENELWEICPVKKSFSFKDLAEFSSFRRYLEGKEKEELMEDKDKIDDLENDFNLKTPNPFIKSNFEDNRQNNENENFRNDSPTEDKRRLSQQISEEDNSHTFQDGPIIANTTLEVCRLIGRYIEIMRLLKPIALDIINSLCQLYDYYMFSIYYIFFEYQIKLHSELSIPIPRNNNNRLGLVLRRIWERLILHDDENINDRQTECRISLPHPCITLHNTASAITNTPSINAHTSTSDTLSQSIVAVESIVYLGSQFLRHELLSAINQLLPEAKRGLLRVFSDQNLLAGLQLREPIFQLIFSVEYYQQHRKLTNAIQGSGATTTNYWNGRVVTNTTSDYILNDVQNMISEFDQRINLITSSVPVGRELLRVLWMSRICPIDLHLLDGYGSITNCSQAGRNQMSVDWQSYVRYVSTTSGISDLFDKSDVERYIKAYYIGLGEFENWLIANRESYQRNHLINLIGLIAKSDKRIKQKWIALLSNSNAANSSEINQSTSTSSVIGSSNNSSITTNNT